MANLFALDQPQLTTGTTGTTGKSTTGKSTTGGKSTTTTTTTTTTGGSTSTTGSSDTEITYDCMFFVITTPLFNQEKWISTLSSKMSIPESWVLISNEKKDTTVTVYVQPDYMYSTQTTEDVVNEIYDAQSVLDEISQSDTKTVNYKRYKQN